ncbi:hypothetical protein OM204_24815, partial [Escherichia albertii]|nr:hypothetical protein [Escherichia albertii]
LYGNTKTGVGLRFLCVWLSIPSFQHSFRLAFTDYDTGIIGHPPPCIFLFSNIDIITLLVVKIHLLN